MTDPDLSTLPDPATPRIFVFCLGSIGDALQISGLLLALKERFPVASLVLIHPNPAIPGLFRSPPFLDGICVVPAASFAYLRQNLLSQPGTDLIVMCRYVVEYVLPPQSRLNQADQDFIRQAQGQQMPWLPYVRRFPFDNDVLWRVAHQHGLNLFRLMALTSGFPERDFEAFQLTLDTEDHSARERLPDRYVVVSNSAEALPVTRSTWTKTLPVNKMTRIVDRLQTLGVPLVQLGVPEDPLIDGVNLDWRGRTSLRESAAILQSCLTFLAPEGGVANLARAVGKFGVVFFGSTPPEFFALRGNQNIRPASCGSCWWTTPCYLYRCPRLLPTPICTDSLPDDTLVNAVFQAMGAVT